MAASARSAAVASEPAGASNLVDPQQPEMSAELQDHRLSRVLGLNEALQDKVKLLENRIARLQDDLDMEVAAKSGGGDALDHHHLRVNFAATEIQKFKKIIRLRH